MDEELTEAITEAIKQGVAPLAERVDALESQLASKEAEVSDLRTAVEKATRPASKSIIAQDGDDAGHAPPVSDRRDALGRRRRSTVR